jgi:HSP20 family protein
MAIIRFDPFREMETMQRQMNRLFDQMMSYGGNEAPNDITSFSFVPAAEIHETPDQIQLKMEIPGVEAQDLDVKVTAEAVAIRGERKSEMQQDDKGVRRSEFRYGTFQRVIPLPARIQNDKVQAEFKNGVLCLTLPKAEEEKNKVVTLNLGGQSQPQISGQSQQTSQKPNGQTQQSQPEMARQS